MKGLNFLSKMANKRIRVWTSGRSLPCIKLISDVITNRDSDLFNRITNDTGHVLYNLLPPRRTRVLREGDMTLFFPK